MRKIEDLQLADGLKHALECEREMDECPKCIELRTERRAWPPARMIETHDWEVALWTEGKKVEFAANFHVLRVRHEEKQAAETSAKKVQVRQILRDNRYAR